MNWKHICLCFDYCAMNKRNIDNKLPIYKLTSKEKVLEYYDNWTSKSKYNKDMINWQYIAPKNSVHLFSKYAPNKNIQILDAGCGSGLVGIEMRKKGYSNITGVDFSKSMLDLIPTGIYNITKKIDLNRKLNFCENCFDAVLCIGTFTYGHVKSNALNEFIRITKNNGLICFTINEGIYKKYNFDKKIKQLSTKKAWKIIEFSLSPYIINKEVDAWLCLAKVIKK